MKREKIVKDIIIYKKSLKFIFSKNSVMLWQSIKKKKKMKEVFQLEFCCNTCTSITKDVN